MDYATITVKVPKEMTAYFSDDYVAESGEDLKRNAEKPGPERLWRAGTRPKNSSKFPLSNRFFFIKFKGVKRKSSNKISTEISYRNL